MTKSPLTIITTVASAAFRRKKDVRGGVQRQGFEMIYSDPILASASAASRDFSKDIPELQELVETICSNEEFQLIAPRTGELDPMIYHPGGGIRLPAQEIVFSLFTSALMQMYFFALENEESVYIRTVIENFEELRKAVRGEPVRGYEVKGLAQIKVQHGKHINTPWGSIRPAPPTEDYFSFPQIGRPNTRSLLVEPKLVPVVFDRSQSPDVKFDQPTEYERRSAYLLPLSCALASKDHANPVVPVVTWSTFLMPFQGGLGYSSPTLGPIIEKNHDADELLDDLENWARIVERSHAPEVDIAAKRLVSAVAHRTDKADSLIDAVMVWENLLGTSNEVTFRVSASLAKLIESDPDKRLSLKKSLSGIYATRSRIVHGVPVDAITVQKACSEAIGTAVLALRQSYKLGHDWLSLSSTARSEKILLIWQ